MRQQKAKELRKSAKVMTVGKSQQETDKVYKRLKSTYKSIKQGR